jgi:hypothetical protein
MLLFAGAAPENSLKPVSLALFLGRRMARLVVVENLAEFSVVDRLAALWARREVFLFTSQV